MSLRLIDKNEFACWSRHDDVYFCNGCLFSDCTDNLLAFPFYTSSTEEPSVYYEVVYE